MSSYGGSTHELVDDSIAGARLVASLLFDPQNRGIREVNEGAMREGGWVYKSPLQGGCWSNREMFVICRAQPRHTH